MMSTKARRSILVSAGLALVGTGVAACRPTPPPTSRGVEIRDMAFDPANIEVRPGDTIVWINRDMFPHTVTAADSSWGSPTLAQGEAWRWVVEARAVPAYGCSFHPTMTGRVEVR